MPWCCYSNRQRDVASSAESYCTMNRAAIYVFYTGWKNKTLNSCPQLPQMLTHFQNSFANRLIDKFATNTYLNIPPRSKHVVTLRCEMWMSENWRQSDLKYVLWLMINHKVAQLSIWVMMEYFITNFSWISWWKNLLNQYTFGKKAGKMVYCVIRSIRLRFLFLKIQNSPEK